MALKLLSESVKQKFNKSSIGKTNLRPTSNARNQAMMRDCTAFAALLNEFEKDIIANWHKKLLATFSHLRVMLLANLPKKYDEDEDGTLRDTADTQVAGRDSDLELLSTASQDYVKDMQDKVLTPAKEWLLEYKALQDAMNELEDLRLEVDARRRTVSALQGKHDKLQTKLSNKGVSPQDSPDVQQTSEKLHHKDQKLDIVQHNYQEMEHKIYGKLCTLVEDAAHIRQQMVAYMTISKDCFAAAVTALAPIAEIKTAPSASNAPAAVLMPSSPADSPVKPLAAAPAAAPVAFTVTAPDATPAPAPATAAVPTPVDA